MSLLNNFRIRSKLRSMYKNMIKNTYKQFSSIANGAFSVSIIGSGPSGMYCAKTLLKKNPNVQISIFEELPTPFGLVRFGVAPDHQNTKNVTKDFTDVLKNDRVTYFGNVKVNQDITLNDITNNYSATILAYGASMYLYIFQITKYHQITYEKKMIYRFRT